MDTSRTNPYDGTTAVVTGASRGLGRALAAAWARRGARVAMIAREPVALREAAAAVARGGPGGDARVVPIEADVADPRDVERIAAVVHERLGPVDWLVHNAGSLGPTPMPLLLDLDPDALAEVLATQVIGPLRLSRRLVGPMVLRGRGTVVAVSSDAAVEAWPRWGPYGASKAASDHLARTFAAELGDTGVRFVIVDPGEMDTAMHRAALPDADPATLRDPARVAEAVLDRLSDPTRSPNGARIVLADGEV